MSIKIVQVNSKLLLNRFIKYPIKLYKNCPYYPQPLLLEQKELFSFNKNPFYKFSKIKLFLALDKNDNIAGRIAAIINYNHNKYWNEKTGFFGFFDAENNQTAVNKLFKAVEEYLYMEGMNEIRGPFNPSTNETCGLLVNSFNKVPSVMMPYNYDYYKELLLKAGYQKIKDLFAFKLDTLKLSDRIIKFSDLIEKKYNVTLRNINMRTFDEDMKYVKKIYDEAWSNNWGFVPMTTEEFTKCSKNLKLILDKDLVWFLEIECKPVGFIAFLPDINEILLKTNNKPELYRILKIFINKFKCNNFRCILFGIIKEYTGKGLDILLYKYVYDRIKSNRKYTTCEMSWILEDNFAMINILKKLDSYNEKRYTIFTKKI